MQQANLMMIFFLAICTCAHARIITSGVESALDALNRNQPVTRRHLPATERMHSSSRRRRTHKRKSHRNTRRRPSDTRRRQSDQTFLTDEVNPSLLSYRVALSQSKPFSPPLNLMMEPKEDMETVAMAALEIEQNRTQSRRLRRSIDDIVHNTPVCDSVSEWVERTDAEDMWGNRVEVLQEIDIGGARVNQYFYETHCRQEKAACVGIDTHRYYSVCQNKYVWAYAKVRTILWEEGWTLIKIRGSCNCALFRRQTQKMDLMDLIQAAASGK